MVAIDNMIYSNCRYLKERDSKCWSRHLTKRFGCKRNLLNSIIQIIVKVLINPCRANQWTPWILIFSFVYCILPRNAGVKNISSMQIILYDMNVMMMNQR